MAQFSVVGLMSGSSLDGVDLAWCDFEFGAPHELLSWRLVKGETRPYPAAWQQRLRDAPNLSGRELWLLHTELGHYFAGEVAAFLLNFSRPPDFVASHGHTVFHFPAQHTTTQIGDGAAMAAVLQLPVIDQFRSMDMALGGQGAPLAPLADKYLFADYFACLNLGGIANISLQTPSGYIAFDVGYANQVFDRLAQLLGQPYDDGGALGRQGRVLPSLLEELDALPYFQENYPKSLGNDWVQEAALPLFLQRGLSPLDALRTGYEHLAKQLAIAIQDVQKREQIELPPNAKMLVAGGGGFNTFLCECIAEAVQPMQLDNGNPDVIAYKEAALMALAGTLRWLEQPNCLPSATGATRPAVGGAIHWGS